jgi:glycosyltransferase involved in cell wall biosynthesis
MLWDKGVGEFVEAARKLKDSGVRARFVLIGDTDAGNPAAVSKEQLESWHNSGGVEWWGRREDMPEVFAQCNIFCLPTAYGEGVPKVLIEAASCGRAIVTSDWPGCREIVRNGENGLLVPVRDADALANALQKLIDNAELRQEMGVRGREIVKAEFSMERVVEETLAVYRELL